MFSAGFQDELVRIEAAMAMEDESGGGVSELISFNQSWFSVLMMSRAEEEPSLRAASSPSIHAASSPSALEPPSTLSPVVAARPYSSQRNSLSHDLNQTEKMLSPLQSMRDRAVTPTRHLKSEGSVSGSPSRPATKALQHAAPAVHDASLDASQESRLNADRVGLNPPVSPLLFGLSAPSSLEPFGASGSLNASDHFDPDGLQVAREETYEIHFSPTAAAGRQEQPDLDKQRRDDSDASARHMDLNLLSSTSSGQMSATKSVSSDQVADEAAGAGRDDRAHENGDSHGEKGCGGERKAAEGDAVGADEEKTRTEQKEGAENSVVRDNGTIVLFGSDPAGVSGFRQNISQMQEKLAESMGVEDAVYRVGGKRFRLPLFISFFAARHMTSYFIRTGFMILLLWEVHGPRDR